MKKSMLCLSLVALFMSSICWADQTVTFVNNTNYQCSTDSNDVTKCEDTLPGVAIQAGVQTDDGNIKPVGDKIPQPQPGQPAPQGSAPIFQQNGNDAIMALMNSIFPAMVVGKKVVAGKTYYVVTNEYGGASLLTDKP